MNVSTPHTPAARLFLLTRLLVLPTVTAVTVGCGSSVTPWDENLVCAGTESVSTVIDRGPGALDMQQKMPYAIRLSARMGDGRMYVKSHTLDTTPSTDGYQRFRTDGPHVWMVTQYEPTQRELRLIGERKLVVADELQTIRTVGRYSCTPSNGPLLAQPT
ncbi:MAG: hypothetical protein RJA09_2890 [Pseudomonadota bacterium]